VLVAQLEKDRAVEPAFPELRTGVERDALGATGGGPPAPGLGTC
jgi:hypothetical protein